MQKRDAAPHRLLPWMAVGAVAAATLTIPATAIQGSGAHAATAAPDARPNVVVIMTDDMRLDDMQALTQTRRLGWADYRNAHASTPLCCPSRATLLSGQYSHNTGVYDNGGPTGAVDEFDDASTLGVWMQNAGYTTTALGKYINGYGDPADGLDRSYLPPGWTHATLLSEPTNTNYTDYDITTGGTGPDAPGVGTVQHIDDSYQTVEFTNRAVRRIRQDAPSDQPMFMWLSYAAPHGGRSDDYPSYKVPAEPKYAGTSKVGLPNSPAVDEARIGDKPTWIRDLPRLTDTVKHDIVTERRERRDALRSVDDGIVRVTDALRDAHELGNTIVIVVSDNGWMAGEHRIPRGKQVPYYESTRVPLLIRGPGFTTGIHTEPVSNVDLAPTIVDAADTLPGHPVDGLSLLDPIPAERPLLIEFLGQRDGDTEGPPVVAGMPTYSGVLTAGTELIDYATGRDELYDLTNDPYQLDNRFGDPALAGVQQDLGRQLAALQN